MNAYVKLLSNLTSMGFDCVSNTQYIILSCIADSVNDLPGISMAYNNHFIELSSSKIWLCYQKNCTLQAEFREVGEWVFGKVLLRNYLTVFNYDQQSLGFAPAIQAKIISSKDSFSLKLIAFMSTLLSLI